MFTLCLTVVQIDPLIQEWMCQKKKYCLSFCLEKIMLIEIRLQMFTNKVLRKNDIWLLVVDIIYSTMYRAAVVCRDMLVIFLNTCIVFQEFVLYGRGSLVSICILTGLDWYWSLIKNQISSYSCLVAQETSFDWMFSGL